ncbi:MAG TPA: hypothetical protein VE999_12425 [Gemmataceae bacterium]|nr:hypothetical protein [Gemmataceae bacterium]
MKPAQWTAILVFALMVGGISFVTVYLGGSSRTIDEVVPEAPPTLTFPIKAVGLGRDIPLVTEIRHHGHQDYWFVNESGQDLDVGLIEKGCTCSTVEIAVAPPSWWTGYAGRWAATQVLAAAQLPLRGWEELTILALLNTRERKFPELPDNGTDPILLDKDQANSFRVPAGAIGRVRLNWSQPQTRDLNTHADLWIGQRTGTAHARLDARVLIVEPALLIAKQVTLPAVTIRELAYLEKSKAGKQDWIICGSLTRQHFHMKAELMHERIKAESDAVELGEPIPVDSEELRKETEKFGEHMPTILSGFKIPVMVKAHAKDGTPVEWGHFRRYIRMTAEDSNDSVMVEVTGEVLGDVNVGEVGKVRGTLDLGPFPRKRGTHGRIMLRTDERDLDLELDASRLPEYIKASLKPKEMTRGHRSWELRVEIPPNAASGEFPRNDSPVYRDSAVYVKTKEKLPRSIRVPVMGTANDG